MPCYHPMTAFRSRSGRSPNGLWPIVFNVKEGYQDLPVELPCGKCIGCRLERSRQWAVRCIHENSMHEKSCFITLTYDNEHLNRCKGGSLNKKDFQLFMKRLRKHFKDQQIRFFHCGEYGEKLNRPHHHACIFGINFDEDRILFRQTKDFKLYISQKLRKIWPYGHNTIGDVTFESAAYVARYITKKITGDKAEEHYQGREPEYITMSRKPGIARLWWDKYKKDVLSQDKLIVRNNLTTRPGKYYDNLYHMENPKDMERIKSIRKSNIDALENSYERLRVKEKIKQIKFKQLKRTLENEK